MQTYSPFWTYLFTFQMLLCFFALFSQAIFMKTTVFDQKIPFAARVHLFFLSVGFQLMIVSFVAITGICLRFGSIFEIDECASARMIPLLLHNLGESLVVIFHMIINLDRLLLALRPNSSNSRASKIFFYFSVFISLILCLVYVEMAHHEDLRKSIAFGSMCLITVFNLMIEIKLYYYISVVYRKTIGLLPLERRFELSSSVTMVKCFLPASTSSLILKFIVFSFYSLSYLLKDPTDIPPYYFILNVFWNLDCTLFPWFFILFHPSKKQKLLQFLKIETTRPSESMYRSRQAPHQVQQEHFDQFKNLWKVGA